MQIINHDFGFNDKATTGTIAMPIVAHEIGHFVGYLLNNMCVKQFGKVTLINFGRQNPRFSFDWTDSVFRVLKFHTSDDFYGKQGYEIIKSEACEDNINFLYKEYDIKRFPWLIVQKLIGGIFQLLHYEKINLTPTSEEHFDLIFSDINDTDQESMVGAAGMDWTSVRMYCGAYQIPLDKLCQYRLSLFNAIKDFAFFNQIEQLIEDYYDYNIEEHSGSSLAELEAKLQCQIDNFEQAESMIEVIQNINNILLEAIKN